MNGAHFIIGVIIGTMAILMAGAIIAPWITNDMPDKRPYIFGLVVGCVVGVSIFSYLIYDYVKQS